MSVEKLLSLIPGNLLDKLAIETGVDYYPKKLQSEVIFKLPIYYIISPKDNSLRTMELVYEKLALQLLNQRYNRGTVKFRYYRQLLSPHKVRKCAGQFISRIYLVTNILRPSNYITHYLLCIISMLIGCI